VPATPHRERLPQDNNFTLTGSKAVGAVDLSVATLIDVCLEENERRLSGYDGRLLRPNLVPAPDALRPPLHAAGGGDRTLLMKIGSAEHKQAVLSAVRREPLPVRPRDPSLGRISTRAALGRLRGIPFWEEVLYNRAASRRDCRRLCPDSRRSAGARSDHTPGIRRSAVTPSC